MIPLNVVCIPSLMEGCVVRICGGHLQPVTGDLVHTAATGLS